MKALCCVLYLALALTASGQTIPRFTPSTAYSVPGATMAVLGDVNGDGKLDIVTANGFSPDPANPGAGGFGVSVLLGNGDGTFQPARNVLATGNPNYVVVGDFDGDGKADIIADDGPGNTTISFLKGNGDGTFQAPVQTVVSAAPMVGGFGLHGDGSLVTADFNRDGKLDLAISYNTETLIADSAVTFPTVQVLLNNGNGTFHSSFLTSTTTAIQGTGLFAGDLNGDGIADLLLSGAQNAVELGKGDGTFTEDTTGRFLLGAGAEGVIADFNRDGILDVAGFGATGPRTPLQWFVNLALGGSGTLFQTPLPGFFPSRLSTGVTADFNGDGLPDFVSTNLIAYNLGNGLFLPVQNALDFGARNTTQAIDRPFPNMWYATGDLDGNGSPDMIAAEDARFVEVSLNTGGNPPLLAALNTPSQVVITGMAVTETVSVGSGAPAGGAVISLSSNSPSALVPATVTIPAGAQSVSFLVQTSTGATATPVTISASYRGITLSNSLLVVPHFVLSSVTVNPATLFGMFAGNSAVGTITLSGPAADGTTVSLSSSNSAALVAASGVTVPPGATTVTFPLSAQFVTADTPVVVSATFQGVTKTAAVTVRKEIGNITITKAEYSVNNKLLKVEGTTTSKATRLNVYDRNSGLLLGQLSISQGKFTQQLFNPQLQPVTTVLLQSTLGEVAINPVVQK